MGNPNRSRFRNHEPNAGENAANPVATETWRQLEKLGFPSNDALHSPPLTPDTHTGTGAGTGTGADEDNRNTSFNVALKQRLLDYKMIKRHFSCYGYRSDALHALLQETLESDCVASALAQPGTLHHTLYNAIYDTMLEIIQHPTHDPLRLDLKLRMFETAGGKIYLKKEHLGQLAAHITARLEEFQANPLLDFTAESLNEAKNAFLTEHRNRPEAAVIALPHGTIMAPNPKLQAFAQFCLDQACITNIPTTNINARTQFLECLTQTFGFPAIQEAYRDQSTFADALASAIECNLSKQPLDGNLSNNKCRLAMLTPEKTLQPTKRDMLTHFIQTCMENYAERALQPAPSGPAARINGGGHRNDARNTR